MRPTRKDKSATLHGRAKAASTPPTCQRNRCAVERRGSQGRSPHRSISARDSFCERWRRLSEASPVLVSGSLRLQAVSSVRRYMALGPAPVASFPVAAARHASTLSLYPIHAHLGNQGNRLIDLLSALEVGEDDVRVAKWLSWSVARRVTGADVPHRSSVRC